MQWIETKHILLLSNTLANFKRKNTNIYNFRCPFCLDSKQSKSKARGYIFIRNGKHIFHCHNCNSTLRFPQFLKKLNSNLYDQYLFDHISADGNQQTESKPQIPCSPVSNKIITLPKVSQLPSTHPCKQYVVSRQIPTTFHHKLYFCSAFKQWTNTIIANKFADTTNDSARLIIPIIDKTGQLIGFQGRSLNADDKLRYITIIVDSSKPRIYGLDSLDLNKRFYVFEGPIDSMFIENSVATCGGLLHTELSNATIVKSNCVVVYDNEPRNKQIIDNIAKAIQNNYNVCIWPPSIEHKDINQMILAKVSGDYCKTELVKKAALKIQSVIDDNVFSGLDGQLKLAQWRKV